MRLPVFLLLVLTVIAICIGCNTEQSPKLTKDESVQRQVEVYDSTLASQVGADPYGMKTFVIAYLKAGPNRDRSKEEADSLQAAHMDNISKMAEEGKLVLAGPFFEEDYEVKGIYVFNTDDVEEAKSWTASDPAIQAGSLEMELHPWYGSASLVLINDLHKKVQKEAF